MQNVNDAILEIGRFCDLNIPPRRRFLSPWLKEDSITLISGWRGAGKTFFVMGILNAVSNGESFGPWGCEFPAPTLLLDGEMPPKDIQERVYGLNMELDSRKTPLYIYSDALAAKTKLPRVRLVSPDWRNMMKDALISRGVRLWAIDNLASLAVGLDENKKQDWDAINQWLLELRFAGVSTIMLHHVNKSGGQRGTSAREDNIDASITLKAPHNYVVEDGARFVCRFTKARVPTPDLKLIADTEFRVEADDKGRYWWKWANVKAETRKTVLEMLTKGLTQAAIADSVGVSRGRVSQIIAEARKGR